MTADARIQTSLQRHAPSGWTESEVRQRAREVAGRAWREDRILVLALDDDRLNWVEREWVKRLGERLSGGGAE